MTHKYFRSCPIGEIRTGLVAELIDECYHGCKVENLSPTETGKWVETLQGTTTGETCTESSSSDSDVNTGKMLACGTAGVSIDEVKRFSPNPIDFSIGNKFFRDTDYRGSGSFPIVFGRTYNSLNLGWRFAYTQRIDSLAPDKVAVRRPGGQSYEFALSGNTWTPDPDVVERLEWQAEANDGAGGWRYTLANNTREFFDANGRLIAIRNSGSLEQTISYSAEGKEMTISGPEGDTLTVELNDSGLLPLRITDKAGRTTAYDFDGIYLQQVNYPNGTNKQYLYEVPERPWLITGIIDENGHRSHTVGYDTQGRAIMSELADGAERVEVSYNADGTTTLTNALGKRTTFHFQTIHGVKKIVHVDGEPTATCQGSAMDYRFDDNGFLIEKTDAESVTTRFSRDAHGLELSRTEAVGLPEERSVTTEWDSALRKPLVVNEGNTETRYSYDSEGRILTRTVTDLTTGASRTTGYSYNNRGLLESVDGPREDLADITGYSYDTNGRLSGITNALGHTTEIVSRDAYGRPQVTRNANGLETTLSYDENGRLATRQVGGETTTMAYDAVGNLIRVSAPGGVTLEYAYDAANRLIELRDSAGNRIAYTLDAMGNRTSETVSDAGGQLLRTQQKVYDELSRLLKSVGAEGQLTTYGYDRNDNLTTTIDPLWQTHQNAYDGLNRLIQQTDPHGGVTRYDYDAQDLLRAITDPSGNTTTYVYDGLGNLLEQHSPDTGTTAYTHDAAGNVLSKTDAKGQMSTYQYDALNRLVHTTYADGSEVVYTYDTAENGIGRLATVTDPSGNTAWQYDLHGRTTARIQTIQLDGFVTQLTTSWQYNAEGRLTGMTYPSGMQLGYSYTNGQNSAITINGEQLLSTISYQPFGPVSGWTWGNGSQSWRGYDLDGRLIGQSLGSVERNLQYDANGNITAITDPANSQLFGYDALNRLTSANDASFNLAWQYDANGNRLSETDADIVTPYSLDDASNRLLAVGDTAYTYDVNGNLLSDGEHSYQYDARDRLVSVDEGSTGAYRYNALGQRVYKKGLGDACDVDGDGTITHDDLKQVTGKGAKHIEAEGPGRGKAKGKGQGIACIATQIGKHHRREHDRDAFHHSDQRRDKHHHKGDDGMRRHREWERQGSSERLFAYDEHRLLGEYTSHGSARQETVWLGNLPVATVQNGSVYYIHADHLGTPRVITDNANMEIWRWEADPFGTTAANEDADGDGHKLTYNLRFPGQYYDEETGRHYNYFRDYDPSTGRYIESDPIGLDGGMNTYAYVGNNPLGFFDSIGLIPDCESIILGTFDVFSNRTEETILSQDHGFAFIVTGVSVGPNLDPRRPRQFPISPGLRTEVWWALKEMIAVKVYETKKTYQKLKVFCTEQRKGECGKVWEFRTNFERTELASEITNLVDDSIETRQELIRLLFVY